MDLSSAKISSRETERRVQELLYEWTRQYFTGQPHTSKQGDVTFPEVDIFFNQTQIASPTNKPQLHFVFSDFRAQETWWASGDLSAWTSTLSNPASGVSYGATQRGTIEEAVHGKLVRTIPGTDIRWTVGDDGLHEEAFTDEWTEVRFLADADSLRWIREQGNYIEQTRTTGTTTWITRRTIGTGHPAWDGARKLVVVELTVMLFVRTVNIGDNGEHGEHVCRRVSDHVKEILTDEEARASLMQKGFRRVVITHGPAPMMSSGFQTRLITLNAGVRYFLPRLQ
jgi:hypothetical protein